MGAYINASVTTTAHSLDAAIKVGFIIYIPEKTVTLWTRIVRPGSVGLCEFSKYAEFQRILLSLQINRGDDARHEDL
jgi:hypothetical protein